MAFDHLQRVHQGKGYDHSVPRRMFQRPLSAETQSIEQLGKPGD
ncbi:DUF2026 family protein [Stenotrophomonas maltophilia]|nr:DUF2026 family protein [Stenotrophomonas maltophilia]